MFGQKSKEVMTKEEFNTVMTLLENTTESLHNVLEILKMQSDRIDHLEKKMELIESFFHKLK